jgi:hypothetical protein
VNGGVIESAATLLEGYNAGYRITGLVQICAGLAGVLLLRPAAQAARQVAARPRDDGGVTESPSGPASYWRSYLTTRRTRPHSPGCTT